KDIRAQGLDIKVARFGPSANLSYAMFSGGGLGWADAAMKRGEFAVPAAAPGTQPDLSGLSCRFEEIPSTRGLILSVLVVPARGADPLAFRKVIEDIIRLKASGSAPLAGTTSTDRMSPRVDGISSNRQESPVRSGCVPGAAAGTANSPRFIAASAHPNPPPENIA